MNTKLNELVGTWCTLFGSKGELKLAAFEMQSLMG
jgi:hypothetical protein